MKILYSPRFIKAYKKLSNEIKDKFEEKENLIIEDIFNSKLKTHKLNGELSNYWSFSIDYKIRVIFTFQDANTIRLEVVGGHDIYCA